MKTSRNRVVYIDNIRNLLVYNVVVGHIAAIFAYPFSFWWPVYDKGASSAVYETAVISMLVYGMPCLLFVSALFILPSMEKTTPLNYLKKRFFRLYLPVIVFVFCAGDIPAHMCLKRLNPVEPSYLETFLEFWRSFMTIPVVDMPDVLKTVDVVWFNFSHTWFLTLLFFLTVCVILWRLIMKNRNPGAQEVNRPVKIVRQTILFAVVLAIVHLVAIGGLMKNGIGGTVVLILGKAVQFPIHQIWVLVPMFLLGFYAYKRQWLTRGHPGSWQLWGVLAGVFMAAYALLIHFRVLPMLNGMLTIAEQNLLSGTEISVPAPAGSTLLAAAGTFLLSPMACVSLLMFFLAFARRFFNKPNPATAFCSTHSINVYVLHYIPVFILGYAFLKAPVPIAPPLQIVLMTLIIIPACLWISHRLVYPYPRIAIAFFMALKLVALVAGFTFYYISLLALVLISFAGAVFEFSGWYRRSRQQPEPAASNERVVFNHVENGNETE